MPLQDTGPRGLVDRPIGDVPCSHAGLRGDRLRRTEHAAGSRGRCRDEPQASAAGAIEPTRLEDVRVVRSVSSDQVRERGAALRRVWAQTTFYLFDPESWR